MARTAQGGASYFDGLGIGLTQKRFLWLAAFYYIFDQVDQANFQYAAPSLIKLWKITVTQVAHNNSLTMFGAFLGAIMGGWIADKIGRKKGLLSMVSMFSLVSICTGLSPNWIFFVTTRFLTGFAAVAMVIIAMTYIAEMLPSDKRGKYQALAIGFGTIGVPIMGMLASKFLPMDPVNGWRIMFCLCGACILLVPVGIAWLKESPRWLVSKGRIQDAEKIVEEITGSKVDLSQEAVQNVKFGNMEALKILFKKEYYKRTLVLVIYALCIILGGTLLNSFYSTILTKAGLPMATVLAIIAYSSWGAPVGDFTASFFSDKGGRKYTIVVFCFICAIGYILQGVTLLPMVIIPAMFISRIFCGGSMTLLYSYLAESFPTNVRANASGMIFGTGRLCSALIQFTVPVLYISYGWRGLNWINSLLFITAGVVVLIWGEKTAGKSLEDLNPSESFNN